MESKSNPRGHRRYSDACVEFSAHCSPAAEQLDSLVTQTSASLELTREEQQRIDRILAMLPKSIRTALEIGARHGAVTRRLAEVLDGVTALDLQKPPFHIDRVTAVQGDVQRLEFPDDCFDCVVCTEVLEHVPDVTAAAREITRVTRSHVLLGVPYRQDTRVGRTTCVQCGRMNPPYGHINSFDETKMERLFAGAKVLSIEYVSENRERTNAVSTWLQDLAGNPYGNYDQEESCIYCNGKLERPKRGRFIPRLAGAVGLKLYHLQYMYNKPRPTWMLVLLQKKPA